MILAYEAVAFDAAPTARWKDPASGYLHVRGNRVTCATVDQYMGKEIAGGTAIGLEPERVYNVYRPAAEIQKGLATINGVMILRDHPTDEEGLPIRVTAENYETYKEMLIGAVGTDAEFKDPFATVTLTFYDPDAMSAIEADTERQLSCGYVYKPALQSGMYNGMPYDVVMADIRFNHIALVKKGRVDGIQVNDAETPGLRRQRLRRLLQDLRAAPGAQRDAQKIRLLEAELQTIDGDPHGAGEKGEKKMPEIMTGDNDEIVVKKTPAGDNAVPSAPTGDTGGEAGNGTGAPAPAPQAADDIDAQIAALEEQLAALRAKKTPAGDSDPEDGKANAADTELPNGGIEGKDVVAMDSAKIIDHVTKSLEAKYRARDVALDAVRPLVGDIRATAHDSADGVYKYALSKHNVAVPEGVNLAGLAGMVNALVAVRRASVTERVAAVAHDAAPKKADDEYLKLMQEKSVRVIPGV